MTGGARQSDTTMKHYIKLQNGGTVKKYTVQYKKSPQILLAAPVGMAERRAQIAGRVIELAGLGAERVDWRGLSEWFGWLDLWADWLG